MAWERGTSANSGRGLTICDGASVVAIVRGDGYPAGKGNGPRSDAAANLIAAAPDLLAALKGLLFAVEADKVRGLGQWTDAARAAITKAEADTFAPTMALALAKRTRGMAAWNHTAQEKSDIVRTRRNGSGVRLTFSDGSVAFIPVGTAEVRAV